MQLTRRDFLGAAACASASMTAFPLLAQNGASPTATLDSFPSTDLDRAAAKIHAVALGFDLAGKVAVNGVVP